MLIFLGGVEMSDTEQTLEGIPLRDIQRATDEKRVASFIEALPAAVFVTDATGKPVYSNRLSQDLLGKGIAASTTGELAEVYSAYVAGTSQLYPTARMPVVCALQGISCSVDDMEIDRPSGRIPLEVHGAPLLDAAGKVVYAIALFKDISARRALEAKLMVADRMAAIGALAAGVAHEINNPLSYVITNLAFVLEELKGQSAQLDEARQALEEARTGAERVRVIVRDLKIFSRPDEDRIGPVDVRHALESSVNMAWSEIRQKARLVKVFGQVPPALGNEARLGQVFLNLLINAAHAVPAGAAEQNEIRIVTRVDGGRVVVEVWDTGSGISKEVLPHIFSPFFTTKQVTGGTGLGLAICHQIIARLGGELTVQTEVGKGSQFRVVLPAADELPEANPVSAALPAAAAPSFKILVVDDEPMMGPMIKRILRDHEVVFAPQAQQALELIGSGVPFDLVLADVVMPDMDGIGLHQALVKLGSHHADKMVFFTGGPPSDEARAFLDRIPNVRLEKPFDAQMLRTLVVECCSRRT